MPSAAPSGGAGDGVQGNPAAFAAITAFCVAGATLMLQLVQTRIYSVVFWNHLVYFIISIALLGFGISGTWLAFGRTGRLARFLTLRRAAVGFVLTAMLSSLLMPRLQITVEFVFHDLFQLAQLFLTYLTAVLPYFFAGWILGVIYRDYVARAHFVYFADLVGAGTGCMLFLALIGPLGAVNLLLVTCCAAAAPLLLTGLGERGAKATAGLAAAALVAGFALEGPLSAGIMPENTKALQAEYRDLDEDDGRVIELTEWNPISRIDVASTRHNPQDKRAYIDGDAWTQIMTEPWPDLRGDLVGAAGMLTPPPETGLVIGSGGGRDVVRLIQEGAEEIDAVEINPTTVRIMLEDYAEASGGLYHREGVNLYAEEGRSYVRRAEQRYDAIVISGIDTFAALTGGAYVLSENYLYTVEAIRDYVEHLEPGGLLLNTRWLYTPESARLFAVSLEALYEMGLPEPERCIFALETEGWVTVAVTNEPFTDEQLERGWEAARELGARTVYPLPEGADYETREQELFHEYAAARAAGEEAAFYRALDFNMRPVWDDSPFFFHFDQVRHLTRVFTEEGAWSYIRGHWASFTLISLFCLLLLAVGLFMGLPLARMGAAKVPHFKAWLLYFTCLGVSFIFIEIALMQRFTLLLGHPSRSLALVLAALLFFAGLGSQTRNLVNLPLKGVLAAIVATALTAAFAYPYIIDQFLGASLWARGAVTVLLVAPVGFFMGIPFPAGLRLVSQNGGDAVPWMWGVNGGCTVLGSVLAIMLAIHLDFTTVLLLGALGYFVAFLTVARLERAA